VSVVASSKTKGTTVFDPNRTLPHLPFFEELAQSEENDPAWKEMTSGLVTLRLVDAWIEEGTHVVAGDSWSVKAVREAVGEIDAGSVVRGLLTSVLDAIVSLRTVDMHVVSPRLLAYARALDFQARWTLAADVYRTVIRHTSPAEDSDSVITAYTRLGFCLRNVNDLVAATTAYQTAEEVAHRYGDIMGVLQARLGDAQIASMRGNLPVAEAILDDTIREADKHHLAGMKSMALHERASLAHLQGDYESTVRLAHRALEGAQTQRERDRILGDLASAFYELGVRSAAREAHLILAATAQEQYVQWVSTISLMEIAADDGAVDAFERYRRQVQEQPLSPRLRAQFEQHVGHGYRQLGSPEAAREWLTGALAKAQALELNQLMFEIESELALVHVPIGTSTARRDYQPTAAVAEIAEAISELGRLTGVT
jgi:tetratricopeptide (TPR) repeat protein